MGIICDPSFFISGPVVGFLKVFDRKRFNLPPNLNGLLEMVTCLAEFIFHFMK